MRRLAKFLIPLLVLVLVSVPAFAAHIVGFNGVTADTEDQVSEVILALSQSGNVSIMFDNEGSGYTLDSTNTTLVITFDYNISDYAYSASGDTANLTVTRNPTNITFSYSGDSSVTIDNATLVFKFGKGLATDEGIDTGSAFTEAKVLAYVSQIGSTTYDNTTTPEKVTFLVYDPLKVYVEAFVLPAPENATISVNETDKLITLDFTNATTNEGQLKVTFTRGTYHDGLVPIQKSYITLKLNNTYITAPVTLSTINLTELGAVEEDGYTAIKYLDIATNYSKEAVVSASFWDTNGTIENGIVLTYTIDPIGGIAVTKDDNYNLTVKAMGAAVVPEAKFWEIWKYTWFGIPVLAWFGIITLVVFIALVIYRLAKGKKIFPEGAAPKVAVVAIWTYLFALATLPDWLANTWKEAWTWVANNPVASLLIFSLVFILLLLAKIHFFTTRD